MVGLEFNAPSDPICEMAANFQKDKKLPADIARRVQDKCFDKGLMLLTTSIYSVRA